MTDQDGCAFVTSWRTPLPTIAVSAVCVITLSLYLFPLVLDPLAEWEFLFQWDDEANFHDNAVIQELSWSNLYRMATMEHINVYEPLGWLLKALVFQLVGHDARLVRVTTAILHVLAASLLVPVSLQVLELLCTSKSIETQREPAAAERNDQKRCGGAMWNGCCISALIYAVHPLNVEVVGWPSAQPYALAALFANASAYCYFEGMRLRLHSQSHRFSQPLWGVASTSLYLCAVLSKSVCVLLPSAFVLLELALWINAQAPRADDQTASAASNDCGSLAHNALMAITSVLKRTWSHLLVLVVFVGVTISSNRHGTHIDADVLNLNGRERVLKMLITPAWTIQHLVWPAQLRVHYQLREDAMQLIRNAECLLSVAFLTLLVIGCFWLFQRSGGRNSEHMMALLYFIIMALPTCGLIQHGMVTLSSNRYAYFPSAVFVPYGGHLFAKNLFGVGSPRHTQPKREIQPANERETVRADVSHASSNLVDCNIRWSALLVVLSTLMVITLQELDYWQNEEKLYSRALELDPTDWRLLDARVHALMRANRCGENYDDCRPYWEVSYHVSPRKTLKAKLQRTKLKYFLGMRDSACDDYFELLRRHPYSCHVHNNVGICYVRRKQLDLARRHFLLAAQSPGYEYHHDTPKMNLEAFDARSVHHTMTGELFEGRLMY
ncbi:TPA: hypothetical protein N0F65_007595 [Lagenidium giganteum]|uniref:Dolichyl-phosphate-mannose--protein mannosyltransferase n=1 Tax=Lagenidium giganteum TaxID=4803 RepID=A0AAV2ZNS9_9STRA|nr:TPA: hypothetical protein N0F65_007595 [Lagenidium giganteum]